MSKDGIKELGITVQFVVKGTTINTLKQEQGQEAKKGTK